MGSDLSQLLGKELANFSKDVDSRKSAMKVLESYVKEMNSKSIPLFLSQLSEVRESGDSSEEYITSVYEVLLRVHGVDVVPHIDNIMEAVMKTLASSKASSFTVHQSCSKVITATARYCIHPIMAEVRKNRIIHSICNPLCEFLLASQENLSTGAALCLKALVGSDNWQFASDSLVNKVSMNVAVALEMESHQTNAHMGLVMALAKKNSLILEAYARLLLGSGLAILNAGAKEGGSQKRLSAIQMVNFLMKSLDPQSIYSELDLIIEEMLKYEFDEMAFVKGAADEALQTARRILSQKERKSVMDSTPKYKSKFVDQVNTQLRNNSGFDNQSPESQTLDSLSKSGSPVGLLNSPTQVSSDLQFGSMIVKQRVQKFEDVVDNASHKDGLFSELSDGNGSGNGSFTKSGHSMIQKVNCSGGASPHKSIEFMQDCPSNGSDSPTPGSQEEGEDGEKSPEEYSGNSNGAVPQSLTLSTQGLPSKFYIGNTHMFTAPSKHVHSCQSSSHSNSESLSENQTGMFTSSPSSDSGWSQTGSNDYHTSPVHPVRELPLKHTEQVCSDIEHIQALEQLVSLKDAAVAAAAAALEEKSMRMRAEVKFQKNSFIMVICSALFLLLALITSLLLYTDDSKKFGSVVPT
ncbi:hypothetical protein SAY87_017642 [Trapa incisa]|uniref:TORTIFOLIA1/SINE1-2 N-terminal domain-containing protein n=1 Tax=Trapa incisa TaxID=236973 RepID=A0AAN7QVF7_9MYRT|nr:hypothetical protein SAY87_017642 [Trapa incisa]